MVVLESLDYEEEEVQEEVEVAPDTEPPVIELQGLPVVEVFILQPFVDPGALALDKEDGYVEVTARGVESVSTAAPTRGSPFVITYHAEDAAGNRADPVERQVTVLDPCLPPSTFCHDTLACSVCAEGGACSCIPFATEKLEEAVVVEAYVPPPDTAAPVITLLGDGEIAFNSDGVVLMLHEIMPSPGGAWRPPGVTAVDEAEGDLTSQVSAFGLSSFDSSAPSPGGVPHVITYTVADKAGNEAAPVRRRILVLDPCPGERVCDDGECSTEQVCGKVGEATIFKEEKPNLPPDLRVLGPRTVEVLQGDAYVPCTPQTPLTAQCDRGAEAADPEEGDLKARVLACGALLREKGLGACGLDTTVPGTYNITYSVVDSAGARATAVRQLRVKAACPPGEKLCSDQESCSEDGVCPEDLAGSADDSLEEEVADHPPTLTLHENEALSAFVSAKQHSRYAACGAGRAPEVDALCEPGAAAHDPEDGNLTSRVLSCPPADCLATGCPGHEFLTKGLDGCLDTSAPVGTIFLIQFVVMDLAVPPAIVNATRAVTIIPPCPAGEEYCIGEALCSKVSCQEREALFQLTQAATAKPAAPPDIRFSGRNLTEDRALELTYGHTANISLAAPCLGGECWVSAWDAAEGDISAYVAVEQLPCGAGAGGCQPCAAETVVTGVCLPGEYRYRYSVSNLDGLEAARVLTVRVLELARVATTLDIDSGASSLEEAQARASDLKDEEEPANAAFRRGIAHLLNAEAPGTLVYTERDVVVQGVTIKADGDPSTAAAWTLQVAYAIRVANIGGWQRRRSLLEARPSRQLAQADGPEDAAGAVAASLAAAAAAGGSMAGFLEQAASEVGATSMPSGVTGAGEATAEQLSQAVDLDAAVVAQAKSALSEMKARTGKALEQLGNVQEMGQKSSSGGDVAEARVQAAWSAGLEATVEDQGALGDAISRALDNIRQMQVNIELMSESLAEAAAANAASVNEIATSLLESLGALADSLDELSATASPTSAAGSPAAASGSGLCPLRLLKREEGYAEMHFFARTEEDEQLALLEAALLAQDSDSDSDSDGNSYASGDRPKEMALGADIAETWRGEARTTRRLMRAGGSGGSKSKEKEKEKEEDEGEEMDNLVGWYRLRDVPTELKENYWLNRGFRPTRHVGINNRLMGGVLLTTEVAHTHAPGCTSRFSLIGSRCVEAASDVESFGVDARLVRGSPIFDPELEFLMPRYYNMSLVDVSNGRLGVRPFQRRHVAGYGEVFPVFIDSGVAGFRVRELYYLLQQSFLGEETLGVTMSLVLYNADLDVLSYVELVVGHDMDGELSVTPITMQTFLALLGGRSHLLNLYIVWILGTVLYGLNAAQQLLDFASHYHNPAQGVWRYLQQPKHVVHALGAVVQLMALATFIRTAYWLRDLSLSEHYKVYENHYATENDLLLRRKRDEDTDPLTAPWRLEEDASELQAFALDLEYVRQAAQLVNGYWLLQSAALMLIILRFLLLMEVNARLAITNSSLEACSGDLMAMFLLLLYMFAVYAVAGHILYGDRVERLSTMRSAINYMFEFLVGGSDAGVMSQLLGAEGMKPLSALEQGFIIFFFVFFALWFLFCLLNFLLGVIGDGFSEAKENDYANAPQVPQEVASTLRLYYRLQAGRYPSLDRFIQVLQRAARIFADKEVQTAEEADAAREEEEQAEDLVYRRVKFGEPTMSPLEVYRCLQKALREKNAQGLQMQAALLMLKKMPQFSEDPNLLHDTTARTQAEREHALSVSAAARWQNTVAARVKSSSVSSFENHRHAYWHDHEQGSDKAHDDDDDSSDTTIDDDNDSALFFPSHPLTASPAKSTPPRAPAPVVCNPASPIMSNPLASKAPEAAMPPVDEEAGGSIESLAAADHGTTPLVDTGRAGSSAEVPPQSSPVPQTPRSPRTPRTPVDFVALTKSISARVDDMISGARQATTAQMKKLAQDMSPLLTKMTETSRSALPEVLQRVADQMAAGSHQVGRELKVLLRQYPGDPAHAENVCEWAVGLWRSHKRPVRPNKFKFMTLLMLQRLSFLNHTEEVEYDADELDEAVKAARKKSLRRALAALRRHLAALAEENERLVARHLALERHLVGLAEDVSYRLLNTQPPARALQSHPTGRR